MATLNIPSDIVFPPAQTPEEEMTYRIISDYMTKLRQTLIEIESKLP